MNINQGTAISFMRIPTPLSGDSRSAAFGGIVGEVNTGLEGGGHRAATEAVRTLTDASHHTARHARGSM